ncbi:MAG: hypothetical protein EPGJADBJ_03857 [Saprospiraceae bacterium]|nr:hypothetical protein [Saprospiraceae bacterium]
MKHLFIGLSLCIVAAAAPAQTSNRVVFSFTHKAGGDTLELGNTHFNIWNGKLLNITRAQFYLSKIEILQPGGGVVSLTDKYLLVNAENSDAEYDLGEWPVNAAQGVKLGLGVDAGHNHLDPAAYPADHPLAPQNPSMHWGWAAGYTFLVVEGEVDNNNDGTPEIVYQFHNLGDTLYKTIELSGTATAAGGTLHLHFDLDYARLFKDIPMALEYINHGSNGLNQLMMNNAAGESFFSMSYVSGAPEVLNNSLRVSAAPNPAAGETLLRYDLPAAGPLQLVLTNCFGQHVRVLGGLPASGATRLATDGLPEGLYRFAFYENGKLLAQKPLMVVDP